MTEVEKLRWRIVLLLIGLSFALFVWPSMYTFAALATTNGQVLLRVNKLTGKAKVIAHTVPVPQQTQVERPNPVSVLPANPVPGK